MCAAISVVRRSCALRRTAPAAACWTTPGPAKVSPTVLHNLTALSQLVMQATVELYLHLWSTDHTLTALFLDCLQFPAACLSCQPFFSQALSLVINTSSA